MTLLRREPAMKHLILTQFGTPSASVALHDDGEPLDDCRRALEHAGAAKRGGKVLFAFDQPL